MRTPVRFLVLAAALLALALTPAHAHRPSAPITVVDDQGTRLTLAHTPQRIISLAPNVTEILFAIGDRPRVVGVSAYSDYPKAARKLPTVISYTTLNLEKILALKPDLVVAASIVTQAEIAKLRSVHLKVFMTNATTIAGILHDIHTVGVATGVAPAADALDARLQLRINRVKQAVSRATSRPTVYFEVSPDLYTAGHGSFIDSLITLAGGKNIAGSINNPYPQLSREKLIAANPQDVILADDNEGTTVAAFEKRPGFGALTAVKTHHVYGIDPNLTNRPGPRIVDALERLARLIHPELYR